MDKRIPSAPTMMEAISSLFGIVERAKCARDYDLANRAWAALYHVYMHTYDPYDYGLRLVLETQDPHGECRGEWYYDILHVVDTNSEKHDASIPLPLLTFGAAVNAVKAAYYVDRMVHNRDIVPYSTIDKDRLEVHLESVLHSLHISDADIADVLEEEVA